MNIARVMFVANYRIGDASLSLQYDHNLIGISKTYIVSQAPIKLVNSVFQKYHVDTTNFVYIQDDEIAKQYPSTQTWLDAADPRGTWLYQQALKLASVDLIDADVILIQDADAFLIKPYSCVVNNQPNLFILPTEMHPVHGEEHGYYKTFKNLTGLPCKNSNAFVSEFMPVLKEDWELLRANINKDFLTHIYQSIPVDLDGLRWFSEYEFLGNWTLYQRPLQVSLQQRLEFYTPHDLDQPLSTYNTICNKSNPNCLGLLLDTETVLNFELITNSIRTNLQ